VFEAQDQGLAANGFGLAVQSLGLELETLLHDVIFFNGFC